MNMNLIDFEFQIKRLADVFGSSRFPSERISLFWDALKLTDFKTLQKAVAYLITESKHAPTLSEFREVIKMIGGGTELTNEAFKDKLLEDKLYCEKCSNTGAIYTKEPTAGIMYEYLWACVCKCGKFYYPTIPIKLNEKILF